MMQAQSKPPPTFPTLPRVQTPGGDEVEAEAPDSWVLGSQPGHRHIGTYGHRCRTQGRREMSPAVYLVWSQRHLQEALLTPVGGGGEGLRPRTVRIKYQLRCELAGKPQARPLPHSSVSWCQMRKMTPIFWYRRELGPWRGPGVNVWWLPSLWDGYSCLWFFAFFFKGRTCGIWKFPG